MAKYLRVTMPDGSKWDVPVEVIAEHRAKHFASMQGMGADYWMSQTLQIFASDPHLVHFWAANNMNWSDVSAHAKLARSALPLDCQEGWVNGEKEIVEVPDK